MVNFPKTLDEALDNWRIIQLSGEGRDCKLDNSGVYCTFRNGAVTLNVTNGDLPLVTFEGTPFALQKALVDWFELNNIPVSVEHSMYIGMQLIKSCMDGYVQD